MMLIVARSLWTFPTTLVGLGLGAACYPFGTRCQFHSGVLEFHSGGIAWLLEHATLLEGGALAITFGDVVLARTPHAAGGNYRAMASMVIPGRPIGPFQYNGTRGDDPNDLVPHEHRRDLRALRTFCAWLGHDDSKALNSLDVSTDASPVPSSNSVCAKCRSRSPSIARNAPMRCPFTACSARPIKSFVTPASADTTTIGPRFTRVATIPAVRSMASASPTEVPPNLRTITGRSANRTAPSVPR